MGEKMFKRKIISVSMGSAAALATVVLVSTPASAAVNDGFAASTTDGCGVANFIDYGTWPSGSENDDYAVVHDYCSDGHGVRAFAYRNGAYLGSKYNGNGLAGAPVYWDPFGNVAAGDFVELEVCLVDGSGDTSYAKCGYASRTSADG
jgi:hypothetical protein